MGRSSARDTRGTGRATRGRGRARGAPGPAHHIPNPSHQANIQSYRRTCRRMSSPELKTRFSAIKFWAASDSAGGVRRVSQLRLLATLRVPIFTTPSPCLVGMAKKMLDHGCGTPDPAEVLGSFRHHTLSQTVFRKAGHWREKGKKSPATASAFNGVAARDLLC